jgi:Fe-S cluster assembly protein SufD
MRNTPLSLDALSAAVGRFPDDGLSQSRQAALQQLRSVGMPSISEEDWKYTDLTRIVGIANDWLEGGAAPAPSNAALDDIDGIVADWIVIDNGQLRTEDFAIDGVAVSRFSLSDRELKPTGRLGGLNVALLNDGLHIAVGNDVTLSRPLGLLFVDHASTGPGVSQIRVDITTGRNSSASIIEYHTSSGDADYFTNSVVDLSVGDGARVDYVRIQQRDRRHSLTSHTEIAVGRDARLRHCAFDFGGQLVRNDLAIRLEQPGSHSEFNGLYLVGDGQHIDNHTRVDHCVGPAESHQEYRGILNGKARGVWNGKAIVHKGADGTDAEQANHNLLLSRQAEIDAKPELEIYADDVKCSHGTTVGQLDETALFYLRSRGLSRREARQLLTHAFAQAIVSLAPLEALHEFLGTQIAAQLDQLMHETET